MADLLSLNQYVQQGFQQGRERKNKATLAKLYSQALGAPEDQQGGYVQQMAAVDPGAAMQAQSQFGDMRKQAHDELGRDVALFVATAESADPATVQQSYAQLVQKARAMGHPVPPTYDPKMLPMLQKYASVVTGAQQQIAPRVIGNALVDPTGKVLYQGQQAPTPANLVNVPDGNGGTVQKIFDPRTRTFSDPQYDNSQQAPQQPVDTIPGNTAQAGPMLNPTQDYPQLASAFPGTQISSLLRTTEHNAAVGGVANSQHIKGTAGDFVVPKAEQAAFIAKAKAEGYEVIPEGDHVHVELPPGKQAAKTFAQGGRLGYTPPKQAGGGALAQKIALARQMGASEDQIKRMVLGGQADQGTPPTLGDTTKTGPAYLATIPSDKAKMVKALVDGRMQFPTGTALKSPYWQELVSAVQSYDPSAEAGSYTTRVATRKAFTSGKQGAQINALNTTAGHLKVLADAAEKLHNGSVPAWNAVTNTFSKATGNDALTNFQAAIPAVASEMERIYRENGGSEEGIRSWKESLSSSSSPEQIKGVLKTWVGLIKSKLDAMNDQYTQGMGTMAQPLHMVNPHAKEAYDQLSRIEKAFGGDVPTQTAQGGGWGIQKVGN